MRWLLITGMLILFFRTAGADEVHRFADSILLHVTFDHSADADVAQGDKRIYTAESLERKTVKPGLTSDAVSWSKDGGREGGALHFSKSAKQLVFYKGGKNVPFRQENFQGTVSLWLRLNPAEDLPTGFVDPLQITDKKWNDASFFIDFDESESRDFRLGAFADYKSWNPTDRKFDDIPVNERPMVVVEKPPFSRSRWTHCVFTWSQLNAGDDGRITLYLNGEPKGTIPGRQLFTWNSDEVAVMLGINYVGWLDDLLILERALTAEEVKLLR